MPDQKQTGKRKAVFIDKDGTLIPDIPYNVNPDRIHLLPGVAEGLLLLKKEDYLFVVISNQSGVAHGYFLESELKRVEHKLRKLFCEHWLTLNGFYYCPHHINGTVQPYAIDCHCRKPKPGLLLQAAEDLMIDLSASWMIGDILNDVEAGKSAGCGTVFIDNGGETEWDLSASRTPDYTVTHFYEAAQKIAEHTTAGDKKYERMASL